MSKQMQAIVLLGLCGVVAYFGLKGTKKVMGLKSIRVSPSKFDLKKQTVSIEILNPSSETIQVKSLVADISLNGSQVASVDTTNAITIKALDKQIVTFPLHLNPLALATITKSILQKNFNVKAPKIAVTGSANVMDYVLPFSVNFNLW